MNLRRTIFVALACWLAAGAASAVTVLYAEDFEQVQLTGTPTYPIPDPDVWSPQPPVGWDSISQLPGTGVPEFTGWTTWRKQFWVDDRVTGASAGGQLNRRERFQRGFGRVAVADPDTWYDLYDPASGVGGLYNTFLVTPEIDLTAVPPANTKVVLGFDTSWRGGCCSPDSDPPSNQTAIVRARFDDGQVIELLRWESAPFFDNLTQQPTNQPIDPTGTPNTPNPNYFPREFDDRVFLTVDDLGQPAALAEAVAYAAAASSSSSGTGGKVQIEFAMEDAGDDGWWALDNMAMYSIPEPMDGDLYIDGVLDANDIDAFALGLLDDEAYEDAWAGESPATRGSSDSVFDFDDIPWFLGLMEDAGVSSPAMALSYALGVPEPTAALLAALGLAVAATRRRSA